MLAHIILWVSLVFILYIYVGYPAVVWLLARLRPRPHTVDDNFQPPLTFVIPAYNEEKWIAQKIENSLALEYPKDRFKIVVACDGCSDRTVEIARQYEGDRVQVVAFPRLGKQGMINHIVPKAETEILVFSDCNAILEPAAIRLLVRHLADPEVGLVTGNRTCVVQTQSGSSTGELMYWRYESLIKSSESALHSCLGAHGQLYAARKSIFPFVEKVGEDFYIPLKIMESTNKRVIFEPNAMTHIPAAASIKTEFERKARAHVSGLLIMARLPRLLNPLRNPSWWEYVSHHVGRMLVPVAIITAFISSGAVAGLSCWLRSMFFAQCLFYLLAFIGFVLVQFGIRMKLFYVPFYFVFANAAIGLALIRWPLRRYDHAWERTERIPIS